MSTPARRLSGPGGKVRRGKTSANGDSQAAPEGTATRLHIACAVAHFLQPLLDRPRDRLALRVARTGAAIANALEPAFTSAARRRGLLGRDRLPPGAALILAPCNAVHTCGMRFSIDLVFATRDGRVLKTWQALPPWRVGVSCRAFTVVELPAGVVDSSILRPGDRLLVTDGDLHPSHDVAGQPWPVHRLVCREQDIATAAGRRCP